MMPYIHVRAWPWVQIVYQLLSYMYIWIIWIASVDSPKQSSRTLIMSIHIWTCCNWSPRASFGLYRCMYGHVGGCPQGMPKVIDHVQYLIFFEVHKPWNRLCCLWMRFWYMVILHTKCMAHVALILRAYWCAWDACSSCQTHNAMLFALLWHGWLMFWICFMHLVLYMDTTTKQPKRNLIWIFFLSFLIMR